MCKGKDIPTSDLSLGDTSSSSYFSKATNLWSTLSNQWLNTPKPQPTASFLEPGFDAPLVVFTVSEEEDPNAKAVI